LVNVYRFVFSLDSGRLHFSSTADSLAQRNHRWIGSGVIGMLCTHTHTHTLPHSSMSLQFVVTVKFSFPSCWWTSLHSLFCASLVIINRAPNAFATRPPLVLWWDFLAFPLLSYTKNGQNEAIVRAKAKVVKSVPRPKKGHLKALFMQIEVRAGRLWL